MSSGPPGLPLKERQVPPARSKATIAPSRPQVATTVPPSGDQAMWLTVSGTSNLAVMRPEFTSTMRTHLAPATATRRRGPGWQSHWADDRGSPVSLSTLTAFVSSRPPTAAPTIRRSACRSQFPADPGRTRPTPRRCDSIVRGRFAVHLPDNQFFPGLAGDEPIVGTEPHPILVRKPWIRPEYDG